MNMRNDDRILYLCQKDVEMLCQRIDSVAIIRDVFKMHSSGNTVLPNEAYLSWLNEKGEKVRSLNMPGYIGGNTGGVGTKIINSNIHNLDRGMPRASGLTLLYDNTSVRITCIMEGAYLSSIRTASVTVLAAKILNGEYIQSVAVIGAGVLARTHIDLLVRSFSHLQVISLFDIDRERVTALRTELAALLDTHNIEFRIVSTAEEAVRSAQLVIPVTTTTTGYIPFHWLQKGALLVNVSLDDPLPEIVYHANKVIVDDWDLVKSDSFRLIGRMYRDGLVIGPDDPIDQNQQKQRRIDAQLGEIVLGTKEGRCHESDIILVNPFGLAIEDVGIAASLYQIACKLRVGIWLER